MTLLTLLTNRLLFCVVSLLLYSSNALATTLEYKSGYGALEVFNKEAYALLPTWLAGWIILLLGTFVIGVYFAWKQPIARWVLACFIISMTTGRIIFNAFELPFLGGSIAIMHIVCWMPALLLLLIKRPFYFNYVPTSFRVWSAILCVFITVSLVFDIRDAAIYIDHVKNLG